MILQNAAVPLQVPGGVELTVILVIFLILAAILVGIVTLFRRRTARIKDLETQLEEARSTGRK